jgi:uncharacterized protein (DUF2237 family)
MSLQKNVLGTTLRTCCKKPLTGFFRNGLCETDEEDVGSHTVCVSVTDAFLTFSKKVGNDLSTPMPQYGFDGLKEGDCWCLCLSRWKEAYDAGVAPKVKLESCHSSALSLVTLEMLQKYALN